MRTPLVPPVTNLFHLLGDTHLGATPQYRLDRVTNDAGQWPTPVARIQVGDSINDGLSSQDLLAQAFLSGLGSATYYTIAGNHDIWNNVRTGAQWASSWGYAGLNYTVDFGNVVGVFISPGSLLNYAGASDNTMIALDAATITYLDTALAATSKDCLIFCHAPLYNSVLGPTSGQDQVFNSTEPSFYVHDYNQLATTGPAAYPLIAAVLAAHSNARAWISGHTHSPISAPQLVTPLAFGGHVLAAINCSAIYYQGRTLEWNDPVQSLWLNITPGVKIDVRFRDHGAGTWAAVRGARVLTVTF